MYYVSISHYEQNCEKKNSRRKKASQFRYHYVGSMGTITSTNTSR